jgi:hypothetical protein
MGLPDDTNIQIVDFDSTVKAFEGTTKEQAIQHIGQITLGGNTALYGVTVKGLEMLQGKERPSLILFTDGINDPDPGGLTDKTVVMNAITKSGIPIYCIGFGPEHAPPPQAEPDSSADPNALPPEVEIKPSDLRDFALLSGGKY